MREKKGEEGAREINYALYGFMFRNLHCGMDSRVALASSLDYETLLCFLGSRSRGENVTANFAGDMKSKAKKKVTSIKVVAEV